MSESKSKAQKPLEVTIMFEPTRIAAEHLADAYLQLVPLRRRSPQATPGLLEKIADEKCPTARRRQQS